MQLVLTREERRCVAGYLTLSGVSEN
jgi:hypothetical protein